MEDSRGLDVTGDSGEDLTREPGAFGRARNAALSFVLQNTSKRQAAKVETPQKARRRFAFRTRALLPPAPFWRLRLTHQEIEGPGGRIPVEWVEDGPVRAFNTLLYLHGGGYVMGSPRTHRSITWRLARDAKARVCVPDYRLAPENRFPAALEDALAVYEKLLAEGVNPKTLGLAGDSAGGGLCLGLLQEIRARGLPEPAALALFSPWTDLMLSGASIAENAHLDPLLPASRIGEVAENYLQGADPSDPRASPLYGEFAGAPPMMLQVSDIEILRDDALRMVRRLREQGVAAEFILWRGLPHVFQIAAPWAPEAAEAIDRAAQFLRRHMEAGAASEKRPPLFG
ncbi:alpha/beta hydrolase [Neomegalonema perideroedes]|uniref:alpha/beta hydrolase n=1 Tax=Neomegalonema perideroedes TaxID=217219 RepID=UPI0003624A15|nr:alpha/beta hydrolase [Neomegalonema perideroedes]